MTGPPEQLKLLSIILSLAIARLFFWRYMTKATKFHIVIKLCTNILVIVLLLSAVLMMSKWFQ